jgi:DNA invertase Pin-like site-specific DNA recombinase
MSRRAHSPKVKESIRTHRAARTRKLSKGQQVGYLRVSSIDQNEVRQLEGLALDKKFTDKASGKDAKRPQLEAMQGFVRDGDTVFCHSMDRLARNLDDLRRIVLGLTERGVRIVFVKENLTFTGEDSPMSNLLLSVMAALAQFERELIRGRQREGIAIARREGKYTGRKPSLTPARAAELRRRVALGDSKAGLAREFGISRDTLYRYVPVKKRRTGKLAK